tara:strand:- start:2821 stop:3228 length:408 start_codon:yes stop_codon:yes gene_type:complete
MEINRVYHPWEKWEDYKCGFYDNVSGKNKTFMIDKVVELFSNPDLTRKYMSKATKEWFFSCEHNLTNNGLNKVAYIGQAASCLYASIPSTVTMEAWSKVPKEFQIIADSIATEVLKDWESFHIQVLMQISCDNKC